MPTLNRKSFRSKMALFLSICGALMFAGVDQAKGQPWIKPLDVTQEITDVAPIVQWQGVIDLKLRSLLPKSGFVDNTKELLGMKLSSRTYYPYLFFLLAFVALLGMEFFKFIDKYKPEQ